MHQLVRPEVLLEVEVDLYPQEVVAGKLCLLLSLTDVHELIR